MSQLRSETMKLFQITLKRDHDWETINELFKLDYVHYVDINAHIQPHQLLFADAVRRCHEASKRILYMEDIFNQYHVEMNTPKSLIQSESICLKLQQNRQKASSKLLPDIERELIN